MTKIAAAPFPGTGRDVQGELTNMIATIGENMIAAPRRIAVGLRRRRRRLHAQRGRRRISARSACWWRSNSTGDKAKLGGARQAARHARGRRQPAVADRRRPRQGRGRARARGAGREGRPERQGRRHHRQDGRGRPAQVLPGSGAARAAFVIDGKTRVSQGRRRAAKEVGAPVRLAGFLRFALGEGIEKKSEDFAAEVAAQLKK